MVLDGMGQVVTTAIGSEGMRLEDYHAADSKVGNSPNDHCSISICKVQMLLGKRI
jgi:hypothetical protein